MLPEKYQPAWGTMPATGFLPGGVRFWPSSRKSRISLSQSDALAGYQLPANTGCLTLVDFMVYLLYRWIVWMVWRVLIVML